jgi:hypothetical protein
MIRPNSERSAFNITAEELVFTVYFFTILEQVFSLFSFRTSRNFLVGRSVSSLCSRKLRRLLVPMSCKHPKGPRQSLSRLRWTVTRSTQQGGWFNRWSPPLLYTHHLLDSWSL